MEIEKIEKETILYMCVRNLKPVNTRETMFLRRTEKQKTETLTDTY